MEASKNAELSHRQPQGSTTEKNSLGCWQGKQQRAVPRNKSNCPRGKEGGGTAQEGMEGLALLTCTQGTSRTWGDAELPRQSRVVQRWEGFWGEGAVPGISQTQQQLCSPGSCSALNEHFV